MFECFSDISSNAEYGVVSSLQEDRQRNAVIVMMMRKITILGLVLMFIKVLLCANKDIMIVS